MTHPRRQTIAGLSPRRCGALLFIVICGVYGSQIPAIEQLPVDEVEVMNARSLPLLLCVAGVLLSVGLWFTDRSSDNTPPTERGAHGVTTVLLMVWALLFTWCLEWFGFAIACALFLVGGFLLLGERRVGRVLLTGALVSAVLWGLLTQVLGVYLAPGAMWASGVGVAQTDDAVVQLVSAAGPRGV